jgi:hypothetical protein
MGRKIEVPYMNGKKHRTQGRVQWLKPVIQDLEVKIRRIML